MPLLISNIDESNLEGPEEKGRAIVQGAEGPGVLLPDAERPGAEDEIQEGPDSEGPRLNFSWSHLIPTRAGTASLVILDYTEHFLTNAL